MLDFMRAVDVVDQKPKAHMIDKNPGCLVASCNIRLVEARECLTELRSCRLRKETRDEIESLEQVANKLDTLSWDYEWT